MRQIICFGDSNTYGYKPDGSGRFAEEVRWSGILKSNLRDKGIEVIEEGLVGRTTVFEDNLRPGRKGIEYLSPLLESHNPLDQLVIMLGTNDCKARYNTNAQVIAKGVEKLIVLARNIIPDLPILLVSPIHLGDEVWKDEFDPEFNQFSVEVSKGLKKTYGELAQKYGCKFLAASDYASPSAIDQEHLDEIGHKNLAVAIEAALFGTSFQ